MKMRLEEKKAFYVSGYSMETTEATLEKDVLTLREKYEAKLRSISDCLYFVSWEKDEKMIYHFSAPTPNTTTEGMTRVEVPAGHFAIATVPEGMPTLAAWHQFFETLTPTLNVDIDMKATHYVEYFAENGICELWIPVSVSEVKS